jgi:hypothetical protein
MAAECLTTDQATETTAAEIARLRDEVRQISKELAQLRSQVHRNRTGRGWERFVRRFLLIRLGFYEQYRPRPLRLPRWYQIPISVRSPLPLISIVTPSSTGGRCSATDPVYPTGPAPFDGRSIIISQRP